MVVMMGAWAQTAPTPQSNGTWQFTMPDVNKLLEVEYNPCVLTLTPGVNGSVAITLPTEGVTDNGDGTYNVMPGTEVTVTATADEHYHLASWSNGATVNTHDTIHVTVTKDTTVTATFAPNTYSLTLGTDPTEGGSVFFTGYPLQTVTWVCKDIAPTLNLSSQYPSGGNSNHATIDGVTVTCNRGIVEPSNNGYYLRIYSYYNSNHPSLNDIVFTCPDGKTFTKMVINFIGASGSYYTEMPGATLNGYVSYGTGSITWIGNATSIGYGSNLYVSSIEFTLSDGLPDGVQATSMENIYSVEYGTEVDLTAAPNDHYHFVKWTDQHSTAMGTSEQLQFTFTKDSTITGKFAIDTFELSVGPLSSSQEAIDAHGWVTIDAVPAGVVQKVENSNPVPGTYKVPYGTTLNFTATPALNYHVTGWSGATQSSTDSSKATLTVTEAKTVSATFAIDTVRLDSVRTTWNVYINGATTAIQSTRYSATDTMGYVKIPVNADVVITPQPEARAVRVSKLELIEPAAAPSASPVSEATTEDIGKIIGADGNIYADVASAVAAGTTANAIIAYVGSETGESGYTHGLAISMKDADIDAINSGYDWASAWDANTTQLNTNYYEDLSAALAAKESGLTITNSKLADANPATNFPAFYAVGNNRITTTSDIGADVPIGTSNWFMPSIFQWQQILQGLSGETAALEENLNSKYTGTYINGRITNLSSSDYALASENPYWSSSESYRNLGLPQYFPWHYDPASSAGWAGKHIAKTVNMPVRAVIAF